MLPVSKVPSPALPRSVLQDALRAAGRVTSTTREDPHWGCFRSPLTLIGDNDGSTGLKTDTRVLMEKHLSGLSRDGKWDSSTGDGLPVSKVFRLRGNINAISITDEPHDIALGGDSVVEVWSLTTGVRKHRFHLPPQDCRLSVSGAGLSLVRAAKYDIRLNCRGTPTLKDVLASDVKLTQGHIGVDAFVDGDQVPESPRLEAEVQVKLTGIVEKCHIPGRTKKLMFDVKLHSGDLVLTVERENIVSLDTVRMMKMVDRIRGNSFTNDSASHSASMRGFVKHRASNFVRSSSIDEAPDSFETQLDRTQRNIEEHKKGLKVHIGDQVQISLCGVVRNISPSCKVPAPRSHFRLPHCLPCMPDRPTCCSWGGRRGSSILASARLVRHGGGI